VYLLCCCYHLLTVASRTCCDSPKTATLAAHLAVAVLYLLGQFSFVLVGVFISALLLLIVLEFFLVNCSLKDHDEIKPLRV
jgi:hypothetical protein